MMNGGQLQPPIRGRWHGLALIVNETVPRGGYVVTDAGGGVLAGGNIHSGDLWQSREGKPSCIYASEPVVRELIAADKPRRLH